MMIGAKVSHYELIEKIGHGSMGVVYKAKDTILGRTVALKFLSSDPTNEEAYERFRREARAASALDHPNVCTVYDTGEVDEMPFIAMAYYDGESLKDRIKKGHLAIGEAIDILLQITDGMTQAHARGLVHRDLKPANIFITTDGIVKILDFGLAKLVGSEKLTKTSSMLGTVAYIAPEQIEGRTADHRADIWSLGIMLFEMLTGELPFDGDYEQSLMYAIVNEEPKNLKTFGTHVSDELDDIFASALQKDAARRYQSVDALGEELRLLSTSDRKAPQHELQSVNQEKVPNGVNLPLKGTLIISSITLVLLVLALIPLKIWRTNILYEKRILYISSINAANSPIKQRIEIAVFIPQAHASVVDLANRIKYPEILTCKNSAPELLADLQPHADDLILKHYWLMTAFMNRVTDGFFDRIDDVGFWSAFGVMINSWLLLMCARRLKEASPKCYEAVATMPKRYLIAWLILAGVWIVVSALDHKYRAHGLLAGAFWTSSFIPGVWVTQSLDFILFGLGSVVAAYLFIVKLRFLKMMLSTQFRHLIGRKNYLRAWEFWVNSGYFSIMVMTFSVLILNLLFRGHAFNRPVIILTFPIYYLPFLLLTAYGWLKTNYQIRYRFSSAPLTIFWISVEKKA